MIAVRVEGVAGDVMLAALIDALLSQPDVVADPPTITAEWHDIAGRQVRVLSTPGATPLYLDSKGEVGFVVALAEGGQPTIEDVLAGLP